MDIHKKNCGIKSCLFLCFLLIGGCNLFSPFAPSSDEDDANLLIIQGKELFAENQYLPAAKKFEAAYKIDHHKSEAWYWHAKAMLRHYGVNAITVKKIIEDSEKEGLNYIPLLGEKLDTIICPDTTDSGCVNNMLRDRMDSLNEIYYPNFVAYNDLRHIMPPSKDIIGIGDATDGIVTYSMISYDYFLCATLVAIFQFLDTKTKLPDSTIIDGDDGHILHEIQEEWDAFLVLRRVDPNNVDLKLSDILDISSNPFDINSNIGQSAEKLDASAKTSIDMFNHQIDAAGEREAAIDNLQNTLNDMSTKMKFYLYSDSSDNDFDWVDIDNDSVMDKMMWEDFNNNNILDLGTVTWNTMLVYRGKVPNGGMKRAADTTQRGYRDENVLVSKGGYYDPLLSGGEITIRFNKNDIIKLFHDTVVLDWHNNAIKFDTVYIPGVTTFSGEWFGGDFGVDEELLDGKDNDMDGLSDEDTRNTKTIDDDDDWFDTDGDSQRSVTIWSDTNANGYIDVIHNSKKYYLGAPNHRRLEPNAYQSFYNLDDEDDADKVDRCKTIVKRNINLFSYDDTLGCLRKPILTLTRISGDTWSNTGFSCPEWTDGDWGIDEDIKDNIDNDWDMIKDEDSEEPLKPYE